MREATGSSRRRLATLVAALAVTVGSIGLTACGEKEDDLSAGEVQEFDLALDFFVNPDHAGVYVALENGFFERAGLDVFPRVPSDPSAPIKEVAAGRADLAISYEPEVLLAREQGLDVVAVAALVDEPLTSLISLPEAGIEGPADLAGKTVATAGIPYQADYLETILERADVSPSDVEQVDVGLNLLPALLGGRADALLGAFRNIEGVDLRLRGENPRVVPVNRLGVPNYDELVLVAQGARLAEDPKPIELFISALAQGTALAAEDPEGATAAILEAGQGLDPKLTRAEINATLPLLQATEGEPFGQLDADEWERFAGFMAGNGLISEVPDLSEVLTNEHLPPAPAE